MTEYETISEWVKAANGGDTEARDGVLKVLELIGSDGHSGVPPSYFEGAMPAKVLASVTHEREYDTWNDLDDQTQAFHIMAGGARHRFQSLDEDLEELEYTVRDLSRAELKEAIVGLRKRITEDVEWANGYRVKRPMVDFLSVLSSMAGPLDCRSAAMGRGFAAQDMTRRMRAKLGAEEGA